MKQSFGVDGIGIQFSGDGNTVIVHAGAAQLHLSRPQLRKAEPQTELELLRVDIRATRLVGRDGDLADLKTWLAAEKLISFRCLHARAGTGKTRLGVELCEWAEAAGWTAGFAQGSSFPAFVQVAESWRWAKDTLVVVDYAASLARDLRTWLDYLAAGSRPDKKLRLLLLERHAEPELGWWDELVRITTFSGPSPRDLADPGAPIALASLDALEDRRKLLAETMRHAGRISSKTVIPSPPTPGENPEFDRRLADDRTDNEPLYLMMAGVEAIHSGAPAALRLGRTDLAERAAFREHSRLSRLAVHWGVSEALLAHLALCVTLQGGCSFEEGVTLLQEEAAALSLAVPRGPEAIVDRLAEVMPRSAADEIDAMRPDLIGEAFLLAMMRPHHRYPAKESAIIARCWARAPVKVAGSLVRAAQDFARGDAAHDSVRWLKEVIERTEKMGELFAALGAMPLETLALREVALVAATRLSDVAREAFERDPETGPIFGFLVGDLSNRLGEVGQREAALEAAREATTLYRELAAQRPDAFQPYLAGTLNNLANRLSEVGQRDAALDAAREAADLLRGLAAQQPGAFRPELSMSLNNLASRLSEVGQREAALAAAREAVDLRRELAAQRPDVVQHELAMLLNNLSNRLSEVGQREAALDAAREAVDLRRELAAQQPDAFRPNLALSLNNLATRLSAVGQREAALDVALEAVDLRRELAAQRPDVFQHDLAGSLNNLANSLSAVGKHEAALEPVREATSLYRELAARRPDVFQHDLAGSLNNLSNSLSAVGQQEAALDAVQEATDLYRELAAQRPEAFQHDLAGSLNNLANCLSAVGQRDAALCVARNATNLYRELAAQRPEAFQSDLATSLNNLAISLSEVGQRRAALDAALEAVNLHRELAAQRPDAFRPDLSQSLGTAAMCLAGVGRAPDAVAPGAEAIEALESHFFAQPLVFVGLMGRILQFHLTHCEAAGQEPDAARIIPIIEKLNELAGDDE